MRDMPSAAATLRPDDAPPSLYGPDGNPQFFNDPAMDRFAYVVLNLASELWVLTEKFATLKQVIVDKGLANAVDIDALTALAVDHPDREAELRDFIDRVFAPLREDRG